MSGIDIVTRAEWKAASPRGEYDEISSTRGVKVHYTGGRVDPGLLTDHSLCAAVVRGIQRGHMEGNGWLDIGYSHVVCHHRRVFEGRGIHRLPAANGAGLNAGHYAVLGLVGNSGLAAPSDGLLHGIRDAIEYLRREGGAGSEIKGHRDGSATDCPGPELYGWVKRGAPRPGGGGKPKPAGRAPAFSGRLLRYPPPTLGADVYAWQAEMRDRGWDLIPDGVYGPRSAEVCEAFQRECRNEGLGIGPVDGIVGERTWRATWEKPIN